LVDVAVQNLMNNPAAYLADISDSLGRSQRHLRRLFKDKVGVSPKTFQKIVRINRVLQLVHQNGYTTLAEIAHRAGYYDHSHLDAEFKEFMGKRPTEYLTEHNHLIDALRWRDEVIDERIIS
jgi:AraC-like DNA-binding protein